MADTINSKNNSKIRIAAFGHRGVGKSTYLTALYIMLVNNTYRNVDFEYTDDDSAAKLAEYLNTVTANYSDSKDWQLPPTVSMPQEIHFLLKKGGQEYQLNLIDYRGEAATIGEMTQNKELLDFFSTCDGLMIFNANDADEKDPVIRRSNYLARHQDLKYLFSSLKNRSGKKRITIPVVMVYTKSDKIEFDNLTLEAWVKKNSGALAETLQNNVETYRTVFLSSQMAFMNVMKDDSFRLTETQRSGMVVKCDADVAHPLFWLIDQISITSSTNNIDVKKKESTSANWWKVIAVVVLLFVVGGFIVMNQISNYATDEAEYLPEQPLEGNNNPFNLDNQNETRTNDTPESTPQNNEVESTGMVYTVSYVFYEEENRPAVIRLRPGPNRNREELAAIECGTRVKTIGGIVEGEDVEGYKFWQMVEFDGIRGYVNSHYLQTNQPNCPTQ